MGALRSFFIGVRSLLGSERHNHEIDEELQGFLEASVQDKLRRGMSYDEAMRASRVEMGSMQSVKEGVRAAGWEFVVESIWRDIRYGVRQLMGNPGFSLVAILTLALGIGANTAIFTLVYAVMLKPLPVAHPEKLYRVGDGEQYCCEWGGLQGSWGIFDYPFYERLRDRDASFEQIAAFSAGTSTYTVRRAGGQGATITINGELVSGNFFATLGVQPSAGRLIGPEDDRPNSPGVVVISRRMWQRHFASDPSIIGSTLVVNGHPLTLAGIAAPEFTGARFDSNPPELWIPLHQLPAFDGLGQNSILYSPGMAWLYVMARLKPGVSPAQAQACLTTELQQWLRDTGRGDKANQEKLPKQQIHLVSGGSGISTFRSDSQKGLYLLSAASGMVLLIACANLANLLLARGAAREQLTALRMSLGATRARLIRAALTESVLLALAGGATGMLFASAASKAIVMVAFRGAAYVPISTTPSWPILGFALLVSTLCGIVFGVAPAWMDTRSQPLDGLRSSTRSTTSRTTRPQKALVVVQAALSVVLLAVAGLFTQSLRNLEKTDLGFQTVGRLVATISFKSAGYEPPQLPALYAELQRRLESTPGVRSASVSMHAPQSVCCVNLNVLLGGRTEEWIPRVNVIFTRVSPHYFETIGTPIVRGRAITEQDTAQSQRVAVVDQAFADKFFPASDPLGKRFGLSLPGHENDYQIVGVVKSAKYRDLTGQASPVFFIPFTQTVKYEPSGYQRLETATLYAQAIELHVTGEPEQYVETLRNVLSTINPTLSPVDIRSYREQVAIQFNRQRLIARLTELFGLLALLLASVGLYGVTAYQVARRTSEIGIRMALGASRGTVLSMVLRSALLHVGAGLLIGMPVAAICGRYLASQLYEVGRFDPLVLGGAIMVLAVCALAAGFFPAHRAASIAPVEALRTD